MLCPGFNHKVIVVGTKSSAWFFVSVRLAHSFPPFHAFIQIQEKSEGFSHLRGIEF